jgi:AhpD family alkylhydroperoxidase
MARVALIDDRHCADLSSLVVRIRNKRSGRLLNLYRALLNSPELTAGWLQMFTAIRRQGKLGPEYRELAIMATAVLTRCRYILREHRQEALANGIKPAELAKLSAWRNSPLYDEKKRAVLAYTEAMTLSVRVPNPVFRAVRRHFDDREIVELTATIGSYNLVSRFLEALQVDLDVSVSGKNVSSPVASVSRA